MAFNFNWSPLIADTSRARDMLTSALNKSPKPPIIVDDIIVTELNLGTTPPELEILEIGDLAEDRFRGIFKMSYRGDAFLTLKTRVQANPLNTYLSTKPSFTSPQPLAAASGLTIPLAITLSDIWLSGFVILVFSRQKGLTIVFRNDPLESLKVSSTFDSIPFVRDYLQKEIEGQLRVLFMEDLPAILHRLSLRMFCPEHSVPDVDEETAERLQRPNEDGPVVDPFASPPQNPTTGVDGNNEPVAFSLDPGSHATFSQKNLLRLAALTDSHRTLSLFTPSVRDSVFRAWAGAATGEYGSASELQSPMTATPNLSRLNSSISSLQSAASISGLSVASEGDAMSTKPSLVSFPSSGYGLSMGAGRSRASGQRKRKKRVIDLRKRATDDSASVSDTASVITTSTPESSVYPASAPSIIMEEEPRHEREEERVTPPRSPNARVNFMSRPEPDLDATPRLAPRTSPRKSPSRTLRRDTKPQSVDATLPYENPHTSTTNDFMVDMDTPTSHRSRPRLQPAPVFQPSKSFTYASLQQPHPHFHSNYPSTSPLFRSFSNSSIASGSAGSTSEHEYYNPFAGSSGGILEQAWMNKMAAEIARKVRDEKARLAFKEKRGAMGREGPPPPAYGA